MKKWLPLILTGIVAAWFISTLSPKPDKTFNFTEFGKLPVLASGRIQPMDSLARNSLLQIREKQEANLEPWKGIFAKPKLISATEWLATVMMDPATADQWPVVRVDNQELISLLKLPGKDLAQKQDGKHYSWAQIQPALHALDTETERIGKLEASQRNAYEKAAMKLRERLWLYVQLKNTVQPEGAQDWSRELGEFETLIPTGVAAVQAEQAGQKYDADVLKQFAGFVQQFSSMAQFEPPLVIPPRRAGAGGDSWRRTGDVLIDGMRDGKVDASVHSYAAMASAYQAHDAGEFNQQLIIYRSSLATDFSRELSKSRWEVFFNNMQPFYNAMIIYILAGVIACFYWFSFSVTLRRTAVGLVVLALLIHTTGLVFRMALEGRPPVTNLYSSAIFIGWGACILGLVLEGFWKSSIGIVVSSCVGFITLIIAHHLALTGDTMEMMRAVLDTNFWLATHVVIVTLGYASTFVAGFLAIVYIVMGVFTPNLTRPMSKNAAQATGLAVGVLVKTGGSHAKTAIQVASAAERGELNKSLAKMVYGIVCFATLFSFVGTVLGGIWADQSWGRFWGWDPKENGALIIVLWNALILHLRWGGMIRERGLINCAIFGNIVTSWSWFGVNMLGIGLHSYGFMDSAFYWLLAFVASQLALIGLGCMPLRMWRSFRGPSVPPSPESGGPRAGAPAAA
jgi:cytochrome c-type biogenesis protein CcsB